MRRLVLLMTFLTLSMMSTSAFARKRHSGPPVDERTVYPGSIDLSNQIGPLTLSSATFNASGKDLKGVERDDAISGHALGVDKLIFDQFGASLRFGVAHGFTLGVPISLGFAPFGEHSYPSSSVSQESIHATGGTAVLLGIGFSPGYEINFGDSAFRFDAQVLARAIFVPVNLTTVDKHGKTVSADALAGELVFEPRITILPYAHKDLGLGFFAEVDAIHPENWSIGGVVQFRFGTR
ncbi:MAG: hypothetical protein ABI183_05435 [Polyangiaceae bacterium]